MKLKKGGLLKNLEEKIKASNEIKNNYEKQLKSYENWNAELNYEYDISYNVFFENRYLSPNEFEKLDEYRQRILDKIAMNNHNINVLKIRIKKQEEIHLLLVNCYYMINKC